MKTENSYLRHIDGLRGLAVLAVVAFHAFPSAFPGGYVGVDVFFVISGYLITGILLSELDTGRYSMVAFYMRRVKRIFPALLLVLLVCILAGWFSLLPAEYAQLGKHIAGSTTFSSNFVLWREAGYFDATAQTKPLLHLWSLGIEEQFYIAWPILLYATRGKRTRVVAVISIVLCGSFAFCLYKANTNITEAFYSPLTRAWELASGSLLATIARSARGERLWLSPKYDSIGALAGVVLIASGVALLTASSKFPGWWALLPTVGAVLIIWAGPVNVVGRIFLSNPVIVGIGLISYPLYLWHWPLLSFARIVEAGNPSWQLRTALVAIAFLLAWLTYRFLELPLKSSRWKMSPVAPLIGALATVGAAGFITFAYSGIPGRYPPAILEIANYQYEFRTDARYLDCWLSETMAPDAFSPKCFSRSEGKKRVLVWGDSHAGRLYPGIDQVLGPRGVAVSQATRDSCPPVLGQGYPNCQRSNEYILSRLPELKIETAILFAAWGRYAIDWEHDEAARHDLAATVSAIRRAGVKKVIVVGPAPEWPDPLPKLIYRRLEGDVLLHHMPERLKVDMAPATLAADAALRRLVPQIGAEMAPLVDDLCNPMGCVTHVPGAPTQLLTWDYGHFTTPGAVFVTELIQAQVM